jgi:hypothetical protein
MAYSKRMLFLFLPIALLLSSCAAIGSIFKAGVWVGIIGIVIVAAIILWFIGKLNKK